jgi:threonylcarbamoyladenosine tRNA methylthiotransferase MtaB
MRVYLTALGCKLNQSEVEDWARRLAAAGCDIVAIPDQADVCIVNTCTVTHVAARKSRQKVRRCVRANPQTATVVTGCFAEIHRAQAAGLPGVSLALGTADKERLVDIVLEQLGPRSQVLSPTRRPAERGKSQRLPSARTRAFVKIQDGCDNVCAYCIVRIARGHHRSRPLQTILDEIRAREAEGYQEIVLTGVHLGAYGREREETLADLVRAILTTTHFPRLRLSSVEPWDLTSDLLRLWDNPRLCRHLHLPLQSGCDGTLQRMNRRYSAAQYRYLVDQARAAIPDLAVTTDIIVGFPGEDDQEFAASAEFVSGMDLARIHVFPFSARPGTAAATMPNPVPAKAKRARVECMCVIAKQSADAFRQHFIGRTMDVLWEAERAEQWSGLTDNYIRVWTTSHQNLSNRILPVCLSQAIAGGVLGELAVDTVG